jgi:predicted unusual protein kinase regulating ubiquinone biosynthesis (AarF/ABC1/UbiB family)
MDEKNVRRGQSKSRGPAQSTVDAWLRQNRLWRSYRVTSLLLRTLYIINRERQRVVQARSRGEYDAQPRLDTLLRVLREFRQTAVALGGLLIKLGQFLGARADLLPPEALDVLAGLQDEVPPERFPDIRRVVERELHAPLLEVFASFDHEPAGSASLGQVHHARLHDGREVAVKVQRPGITRIIQLDLASFRFVLGVVRRLVPRADRIIDLRMLYREFSRTIFEELDYQRESQNARQFAQIFAEDESIGAPVPLDSFTTKRVLTLTWVDGIKISQTSQLDAAGVDRIQLAVQLVNCYFKQVLESGFFHADPHPGNIFVQPGASADGGPRLMFVDFGMMGMITPRLRQGMLDCFAGITRGDSVQTVRGLDALGFLGEEADREVIEQAVGLMLGHFRTLPFGHIRSVNQRQVMGDIRSVLYDQPLRLPAQFAFFGRMVGMLTGLATTLDPNFNFLAVATPYAQQFLGTSGGINSILGLLGVGSLEELGRTALQDGIGLARSLVDLPRRLDRVLARAERGDLHVVVEQPTRTRNAARGRRGTTAAASSPVQFLSRPAPLWLPLGLAAALVALITANMWRAATRERYVE